MRWSSFPALLSIVPLGCGPDVALKTWERIDLDAVQRQLDEPTAPAAAVERELARDLAVINELLGSLSPFARDVFAELDDQTEAAEQQAHEPSEAQRTSATGASFYIRWSCPGPDLAEPEYDFDHGSIFIDSPGLEGDELDDIRLQGDALLSMDDCRIDASIFRGESPAFYRTRDPQSLVVDLNLEVESTLSDARLELRIPIEFTPEALRYAILVDGEGTVTVAFEFKDDTFSIRASDGIVVCDASGCDGE